MTGDEGAMLVKPGGARHSNEYGAEDVVGIVVEVPEAAQDRLALRPLFADRRLIGDDECARVAAQLAGELRWRGPGQRLLIEGRAQHRAHRDRRVRVVPDVEVEPALVEPAAEPDPQLAAAIAASLAQLPRPAP